MSALTPPLGVPKSVVLVLLDSLNRHLLGAYGSEEFATPNLDRFAARAVRFDRHYAGSLPCMPARHDILCGALDFLWRPWGSIEAWEDPITVPLRAAGVVTMLVTDHPHLFETGGENYHCDFTAWDYQRGHEGDPWKTRPDPSWAGAPGPFRPWMPYDSSRGWFQGERDFPGPRTMRAAASWLTDHAPHHDRFFLFVDEFDPHEPFDTPEPYASMYDDSWRGPHLIWPPYANRAVTDGVLTERQAHQIRACYGAKLTMIDHWFGRVLDALDARDLWDDTAVVVCTDHGHYLGERDIFGKPAVPLYEPISHLPLLIQWPGIEPGSRHALTTSVDLHATIADVFGVEVTHRIHGRSLAPIITGQADEVRDHVLAGIWGREVHLIDGTRKYARAPVGDNEPISVWSNRWSTMPGIFLPDHGRLMAPPDDRAFLDRMPGSTVPVVRQPYRANDPSFPHWGRAAFAGSRLFNLADDPKEEYDLAGTQAENDVAEHLREALRAIEAPDDQLVRLGLG